MLDFFQRLISSNGFMPHGHCYLWTPGILRLHVISDALIVLAYYSIPIVLVYFVRKRKDLMFGWVFLCFAIFILACGTTHLLEIWNVWHSNYWLSGSMKALTALASVPTAILLTRLMPAALALEGPEKLQRANAALEEEIQTRRRAEEHAGELNATLERRVAERTAELNAANGELLRQMAERQQADERFRLVVEASPSAIVLANAQGRILLVNSGAEKLFGHAREELTGQLVEMLVPERFRAAHPGYRAGYVQHPEARLMGQGRDLFALRKDGSEVPVEIGLSPIQTAEGPLVLSAIVDITERKRSEEALRARELDFRASFYSSAVGQAQVEPGTGQYLRVNPKFCEIAGYSEEELLGMTFHDLTHPDDREDDGTAHERMVSGEVSEVSREKRYLRKDGRSVWVNINASLIRDHTGRPLRTLAVVQDITERKRAVEDLRLKQEHSESLLRLSRKLERALTTADILKASREEVQRTIGFNAVWFYLVSDWGFFKLIMADEGTRKRAPLANGELLVIEGDRMLEEIAAAENIVVVEDARTDPRTNKAMVEKLGNRTIVNVPITLAGEKLGVIGTGTFDDEGVHVLTPAERDFLSALASHLAAVIDRVMAATERKRAEEARRASEARLNFALQTTHIGAWDLSLLDHTAHRTLIHDRIFGYETLLPLWTYEIFLEHVLPEDRAAVDRSFREATAAQTNWSFECRIRRADGEVRWIWAAGGHEEDSAGKAVRISGIVQDITERKQTEQALRESEAQFRSMVDAISQLAWMAQPDGHIYWYNQRWFDYTGTTPEEMEGWGWQRVHDPEMLPKVLEGWKVSLATGAPFEMNFPLRAADGHYRWFLTRAFPVRDGAGRVLRWCGTNTDISRMRDAEKENQKLNSELEQRVIERTAQLEAANKELEAFSYSVSHDLRAPLRAVDGFSQAVLDDYGPHLPEEGQRYLHTIRGGAQRMGMLIDDLLTFSRLSRAPLNKQEVKTGDLVRNVLTDLRYMQEGRQIELRIGELPGCAGDPALLKQVWVNLLSNALKYTQKREAAVVEIGCEPSPKGDVFFVKDNGTGFDMRYAGKLFGVFQRLHRAEEYEGTGVGLAIVQRVIHRHGGRIWAEAAVDRGATFYFTLEGETKP